MHADFPAFMQRHGATALDNGWPLLPIMPGAKMPGHCRGTRWGPMPDWSRFCGRLPTPDEVEQWASWPGCAVGIPCGAVVGLDIDVLDEAVAHEIERITRAMFGEPLVRVGLWPKRMLVYRAAAPFPGRKRHPLEVLAHGQQFVAWAIHPSTGSPYRWLNDASPFDVALADVPAITEAQALAWLDRAFALVPAALRPKSLGGDKQGATAPAAARTGKAPRGTVEAVRAALAFLPNDDLDGASWITVGLALKAALGEAGRDLWLDWSKSSGKSGASGKGNTAEQRWESFRPHSIGAGSLYRLALDRGWRPTPGLILNGDVAEGMAARGAAGGGAEPEPPPRLALPRAVPVAEARALLGDAVAKFFRLAAEFDHEAEDGPAPVVHGIRVGVGVGKSAAARLDAARLLVDLRKRGDGRSVALLVPTHKLAEEQAREFRKLPEVQAAGLRVEVWRGRERGDPEQPGKAMCHDLDAVREVQSIGLNAEQTVCRNSKTGAECVFHKLCGFQLQKRQEADLWIGTHELLFHGKPGAFGDLAAVVVDEAAWQKGLVGVEGAPLDLTLDAFDPAVSIPLDLTGIDTANLRHAHRRKAEVLAGLPNGPLRRADLLAAGFTAENARVCAALTWRLKTGAAIEPGMPADDRRAAVAAAAGNRVVMRRAQFFEAMAALLAEDGPEASGWASLATVDTDAGPMRVVRLRGRREVAKGWRVPTLHLDALLAPDLLRPYWPGIEVTAEIEAAAPRMRLRQLSDIDVPKSRFVPDERQSPGENKRRLKNSAELRAVVMREARATNGRVLVVTHLAAEEHWRQCGPLPGNVEFAHFNAVAGRDEWGPGPDREGVRLLVVVGRPLPKQDAVERMAEALTGRAMEHPERWDQRAVGIAMADGGTVATEADCHPDPVVEAIRWQICEGELVQVIGRGRGVNRTEADPLDVLMLTNRPLPLPVAEVVTWKAIEPAMADLMLNQAGIALESPTDAARCFADLWRSDSAAKQAAKRERDRLAEAEQGRDQSVTFPYRKSPIGECHRLLRRATYQKAGPRQRPATLVYDPAVVPDPAAWLADRLGPLAVFTVEAPAPKPVLTPQVILVRGLGWSKKSIWPPLPSPSGVAAMWIIASGFGRRSLPPPDTPRAP